MKKNTAIDTIGFGNGRKIILGQNMIAIGGLVAAAGVIATMIGIDMVTFSQELYQTDNKKNLDLLEKLACSFAENHSKLR